METSTETTTPAALDMTSPRDQGRGQISESPSKIVEWDTIQQIMFDLFSRVPEVTYLRFRREIIEKCGRGSFEKHKSDIKDLIADFADQMEKQKRSQALSPRATTSEPAANAAAASPAPPMPPPANAGDDMIPPARTNRSLSSLAQKNLEAILDTPLGQQILHKEAEFSGRDIEACRAKLIRAVRTAAKLKKNMRRLSNRMSVGRIRQQFSSPGPGTTAIQKHASTRYYDSPFKSPATQSRRRSVSDGNIRIPEPQQPKTALMGTQSAPKKPSIVRYTSMRTVDKAIRKFNLNVKMGMKDIMRPNVIGTNPVSIGDFLRETKGLNKEHVGEVLGRPEDLYLSILDAYVAGCEFKGLEYKVALRQFLNSFRLPKEAQKIERIVATFAKHYINANPDSVLKNQDTVFVVCYAILMLNTSLHSAKLKASDRMTKEDFVKMLKGCNNGRDLPAEVLYGIYDDIKAQGLFNKQERADVSGTLFTKPKMAGPLAKRTSRQLLYQKRWMLLTEENQLFYFKNKDSVNPLGFITLKSARLKVKGGCIHLLPLKGERHVKSVKIFKEKPSELGQHTFIFLKVPKADKEADQPDLEDWVAAMSLICTVDMDLKASLSPKSPQNSIF